MKLAVAVSADFRKVSGHAGQNRRWLLFEAESGGKADLLEQITLDPKMVFHHYKEEQGPHPLDGVGLLIFMTAGEGFLKRMGKKGVKTALTSERDPAKAARDYMDGKLKAPRPPGLMSWVCKVRDLFSEHR